MLIRDIEPHELPKLIDGAKKFFVEGRLFGDLNEQSFIAGWENLLKANIGLLVGAFEGELLLGAMGGTIYPDFPTGDLVASEFFWYCLPETRGAGLKIFKRFESQAVERGAKRIVMVHLANLNDQEMERLFLRYGYALAEKVYIKNL